jgi:DNA-binding NarL/FixJ family response regulator
VVIVEDGGLLLEVLATALAERGMDVAGRARDADEALRIIDEAAPDIALLDIRLPPNQSDEGIRLAEQVRERYPDVGLLVLSAYAEIAYAERLMRLRERVGYVLKERVGDLDELIDYMRRVCKGDIAVDTLIINRLMDRPRARDPLATLTPHERRILALVAEGRSNLGIAQHLGCQISTVEKHLSAVTTKLGLTAMDDTHRRGVNVRVLATLAFLRGAGCRASGFPHQVDAVFHDVVPRRGGDPDVVTLFSRVGYGWTS